MSLLLDLPDNYEIDLYPSDNESNANATYIPCLFYGIELSQRLPTDSALRIQIVAQRLHANEATKIVLENGWMIRSISEMIFKQYLICDTMLNECRHNISLVSERGFMDYRGLERSFQEDIEWINGYLKSKNTGLHLVNTHDERNEWDFMAKLHLVYQFPADESNDLSLETLCRIDTTDFHSVVCEFFDVFPIAEVVPKLYCSINVE